jgi:hypothetical protein
LKKIALIAGALLAITATPALAAGGMNISWNDYGSNGLPELASACASNTGTNRLVVTFVPPADMPAFAAFQGELELHSDTVTLPLWWQLRNEVAIGQTGQCRNGALSASIDFSSFAGCEDPYAGQGTGGIGRYTVGFGGPNRARLNFVFAVPPGSATRLVEGVVYAGVSLNISNIRTTGTGSCAGCNVGVCVRLLNVELLQPPPGASYKLTNPTGQDLVTWNNPRFETCANPCPTTRATWGSIKALYR